MHPYIGITDFTSRAQVKEMLRIFDENKNPVSTRRLHVGVMMSYKTLYNLPTKWAKVFPLKRDISGIFVSDETFNCLHFADYDDNPDLRSTLLKIIHYGGCWLDAIQLDMVWPAPTEIVTGLRVTHGNVGVILQIGKKALDAVDNNPDKLVEKLADYSGVIDRVLLDKSMGKGLGMDAESLIPLIRAIRSGHPKIGIGVAGGLGPETLDLVKPIAAEFPYISIDAQGRLRPSGNALDPINWEMAGKYLVEALKILS